MGGRPRALQRPLCESGATCKSLSGQPAQLVHGSAQYPHADFSRFLAFHRSHGFGNVVCGLIYIRGRHRGRQRVFQGNALDRHYLGYEPLHLRHHLGCGSTDLYTGLSLSALHARRTGYLLLSRTARRSSVVSNEENEPDPEAVDLDHYRPVSARAGWHALSTNGSLGVRPHAQSCA